MNHQGLAGNRPTCTSIEKDDREKIEMILACDEEEAYKVKIVLDAGKRRRGRLKTRWKETHRREMHTHTHDGFEWR